MGRRSWPLHSHIVSLLGYLTVFDEASELKSATFCSLELYWDEHLIFYIISASEYPLNASNNGVELCSYPPNLYQKGAHSHAIPHQFHSFSLSQQHSHPEHLRYQQDLHSYHVTV